jgi:phosphosulfolactate synthase
MTSLDATNPLTRLVFETRTEKPRDQGITMMADWGLDPQRQANLLSVAGPFIDQAKIAVGIGALLPQTILTQKLESYRQHNIVPFPGGQFLEHAVLNNKRDEYLQAVTAAGFDTIEVSDNLLEISLDEKCEIIRTAREQHGLRIFGEVGKKEGMASTVDLAEDAARCLESGSEIVFLEAADFFSGDVNEEMLEKIISRCGLQPLVFELPGPWIAGVTLSDVHQMTCWLLNRFGTDTNIANVGVDEVLKLEALRLKIGVNAGGEES